MKLAQLSLIALVGLITTSTAVAETKISAAGLSIKIAPENGRYEISVNGAGGREIETGSAFALSNPPRIVIDLPNFRSKGSVTKNVGLEGISTVRIGSHPDKTRVVFDLTEGTAVNPGGFHAKTGGNSVVLSLKAPTVVAIAKSGTTAKNKRSEQRPTPVAKSKRSETGGGEIALKSVAPSKTSSASGTESVDRQPTSLDTKLSLQMPSATSDELPEVSDKTLSLNSPAQSSNDSASSRQMVEDSPTLGNGGFADGGSSSGEKMEVALNVPSQSDSPPSVPTSVADAEQAVSALQQVATNAEAESEPLSGALVSEVASQQGSDLEMGSTTNDVRASAEAAPTPSDAVASTATDNPSESVVGRAMVDSQQATPPPVSEGTGSVKGIYFRPSEQNGEAGLLIETVGLQNYWFSRKDKKLFEITLENTQLSGDFLTLAQFPPNQFEGFEAVSAEQRGKDSVVKVFVGEEYRIAPFRKEGQLWVKAMK